MDKQFTEQEKDFLARTLARKVVQENNNMAAARDDDAKQAFAFEVIYANNVIRRLGIVDEVDRLTLEQFRACVHNADAEIKRQKWTEYTPRIL